MPPRDRNYDKEHADRRTARLAAHQAGLSSEQRVVNRDDWDEFVTKQISVMGRKARERAKKAFITTAVDPLVGICDTPEEAEAYFRPGGTRFNNEVLRKYLEVTAISRRGNIRDTLSLCSLRKIMTDLFGAAKGAGNPIEGDLKQLALHWMEGSLLPRGLIHKEAREKRTPIPEDITTFLAHLFHPDFMATLPTTRDILLIVLFVCLEIDCSSRASELLMPGMPLETKEAYKVEHKDKMFTWECVEVFAFRDEKTGPVRLIARLTFRCLKGSLDSGYNKKKTIPLRLLPPEFAAEDSLFWLMVLGLIDQVFVGISSWSDIDQLQPGPRGLAVPIKESMKQVPVFRAAVNAVSKVPVSWAHDELINKEQLTVNRMHEHLRALSRFCGLDYAILPNVLRRGSAYILANTVSAEERRARMGHGDSDSVYWKYYRNTTSTVDFQALRHNVPQQNVSVMSSLFLGTGTSGPPPDRVSEKGLAEIYQDPELLALLDKVSAISDELIREHGSLKDARVRDPYRHEVYKELSKKHSMRLNRLREKKYEEEYRAHFNLGSTEAQNIPIPQPGPSQVDVLLDEEEDLEVGDGCDIPVDPELVAEEAAATEALAELALDLKDGEESAEKSSDAVQECDPNHDDDDEAPTTKKPTLRFYGRRKIARHTLIDEVPAHLYNRSREEAPTWKSLSAYFIIAFNHLHPADRFYPGQEPPPGTYDCRFCGVNFHTMHSQQIHVHADLCEAERLFKEVLEGLQALDTTAVSTCPLTRTSNDNGTSTVACKAKPQQWLIYRAHLMKMHREPSPSKAYSCPLHETPFLANSLQDFRAHIVTAHNVPTCIIPSEKPSGGCALLELIYFCPFCQVWIPRTEEFQEHHLAAHIDDAVETIAKHGLAGDWMFHHWTHPGFCPFCVYDTSLNAIDRFDSYASPTARQRHIVGAHLKSLTDRILCPATAATPESLPQCTNSSTLNVEEMQAHLAEAHGYEFTSVAEKTLDSDSVQPKKKAKSSGRKSGRKALQEVDANQQVIQGDDIED